MIMFSPSLIYIKTPKWVEELKEKGKQNVKENMMSSFLLLSHKYHPILHRSLTFVIIWNNDVKE